MYTLCARAFDDYRHEFIRSFVLELRTWVTEVCLISLLVTVQGVLPPLAVKPGCNGKPVRGSTGSSSKCLRYIKSSVPELLLSGSPSLDNGGDTTQSWGTPAKGVLAFRTDPASRGCHVASCRNRPPAFSQPPWAKIEKFTFEFEY